MTLAKRIFMGKVPIDVLTFEGAIDAIQERIEKKLGGTVFTPNVDHVVMAQEDARFLRAYDDAAISLVDGMPVLWASRLLGSPLPEKISGSDLMLPLMKRASERGWRVFLLGGAEGVGELAKAELERQFPGIRIVGTSSPRVDVSAPNFREASLEIARQVKAHEPDLVMVAFGAPKQELWSHEVTAEMAPAVLIGVGASVDFVAGTIKRAPEWMSRVGMEWFYRLVKEPRRMWKRYLVRDPKFALVVFKEWRGAR
jgi:N-acetylglucosaminyldiphosphoundecaprenol N-acetyl-beta-D-mannosaminyltransferase